MTPVNPQCTALHYLEAPTKFYRVGVFQTAEGYWVVFNWGAGKARGDGSWKIGQSQIKFFAGYQAATQAASEKAHAKAFKPEYTVVQEPLILEHIIPHVGVPTLLADWIIRYGGRLELPDPPTVPDNWPPVAPEPAKIETHSKTGALKPVFQRMHRQQHK